MTITKSEGTAITDELAFTQLSWALRLKDRRIASLKNDYQVLVNTHAIELSAMRREISKQTKKSSSSSSIESSENALLVARAELEELKSQYTLFQNRASEQQERVALMISRLQKQNKENQREIAEQRSKANESSKYVKELEAQIKLVKGKLRSSQQARERVDRDLATLRKNTDSQINELIVKHRKDISIATKAARREGQRKGENKKNMTETRKMTQDPGQKEKSSRNKNIVKPLIRRRTLNKSNLNSSYGDTNINTVDCNTKSLLLATARITGDISKDKNML